MLRPNETISTISRLRIMPSPSNSSRNWRLRETAKKVSHFRSLAEHVKPRLVSLSGLNALSAAGFVPGVSRGEKGVSWRASKFRQETG